MDTKWGEQMASWIRSELDIDVLDRAQTNTMACLDYQRFMEGLAQGKLFHSGDAGLTSHAMNAIEQQLSGGDVRFYRPRESRGAPELQDRRVIDALTAAAMVHSQMVAEYTTPKRKMASVVDWDDIDTGDE